MKKEFNGARIKAERRAIFSALRKVEGHIDKMSHEINWLAESLEKFSPGLSNAGQVIQVLHGVAVILRRTIVDEYGKPGYKKLVEEAWEKLKKESAREEA